MFIGKRSDKAGNPLPIEGKMVFSSDMIDNLLDSINERTSHHKERKNRGRR